MQFFRQERLNSASKINGLMAGSGFPLQPSTSYNVIKVKLLHYLPSWRKSRYFLTGLGFAIWMLFFDDRDIITTHIKYKDELRQLQQSKLFYEKEITNTKIELEQLRSDAAKIEKYAREKYYMKRDNEDL